MNTKYRKKAITVEAIEFTQENIPEIHQLLPNDQHMFIASPERISLHIETPRGHVISNPGDYITKEGPDDYFVYPPRQFNEMFEEVDL